MNIEEKIVNLIKSIRYAPGLSIRRKNKILADLQEVLTFILLDKFNKNN